MRRLQVAGALVAAAGLFAAFAWPLLSERIFGTEKARLLVFDRDDGGWERGWRPVQVDLSPADNPVRVVIEATFAPSAMHRGATTALVMVVARDGAVIKEAALEMPLPGGGEGAPQPVTFPTPEFEVARSGRYTITVRSSEAGDAGFLGADAVIRAGGASRPERWQVPGYVAIAVGAVVYILGGGAVTTGRRRRQRRKSRRRR